MNYSFGRHDVHPCVGTVKNTGKKSRHPMFSRVSAVILAVQACVVSSFRGNCRSEFADSPYSYCTKDEGSRSLIDYFLASGDIGVSKFSICIYFPLLLFKTNDHYPIMFFFSIPVSQVDRGLRSRRSVPYDVKRVGVPECDAVFLSALAGAPSIPLVIEPTSHCRLLEEIVVSAACDAYPFEKIRKKTMD